MRAILLHHKPKRGNGSAGYSVFVASTASSQRRGPREVAASRRGARYSLTTGAARFSTALRLGRSDVRGMQFAKENMPEPPRKRGDTSTRRRTRQDAWLGESAS